MTHTNGHRLFFGFEHHRNSLYVVGIDRRGTVLFRAGFPFPADAYDLDLDDPPVADMVASLRSFVRAHDARPACATDRTPGILEPLAERIGGPVRCIDTGELYRLALPGSDPLALRRTLGLEAHQRALLAGMTFATPHDEVF